MDTSTMFQLEHLKRLLDNGILTLAEFETQKRRFLDLTPPAPHHAKPEPAAAPPAASPPAKKPKPSTGGACFDEHGKAKVAVHSSDGKEIVVAVGSTNPVKVNAVRRAFTAAFPELTIIVVERAVASGVQDQPWGDAETRCGAVTRCRAAAAAHADGAEADYSVGLEGGVGDCAADGGAFDGVECFAVMAVLRTRDARLSTSRSATFLLPPRVVRLMRGGEAGHGAMELGDADDIVFGDSNSKQKGGTVAKATNGAIDRTALYEHALLCALAPFLHDESKLYDA
ncbi:inosine triphosphate pyrophosphatase-like protein [Pelagophyceae sp. CCMP2097]|nr:inosine triphosphate pyrophosphatase-like protein [Pelagophyceae sp. CCMP2097]